MIPLKSRFYAASLAVLMSGVALSAVAATTYKAIGFETPYSFGPIPNGLGPNGEVAGEFAVGLEGVQWDNNGKIVDTFKLGAESYPRVYAINSAGQALVEFGSANTWLWTKDTDPLVTLIGPLDFNINNYGNALNRHGHVVGWYLTDINSPERAFLWVAGQLTDLGTLPGGTRSSAAVINSNGDIAGSATTADGSVHAVLWRNGAMVDLGTLSGDTTSFAMNINETGDVVGLSVNGNVARPFRWSNGVMTALTGSLDISQYRIYGGSAPLMNNSGHIVASRKFNGRYQAILWVEGTITELNPILGSIYAEAKGINDAGQILAGDRKLIPINPGVDVGVLIYGPSQLYVTAGQPFTYSLNVTNSGSLAATGVNLTDTLPAGVTFVSATTSQGYCNGSTVVTCALDSLAAGASANVQITVTPVTGQLVNNASVTSVETDVNPINNNSSYNNFVSTPVPPPPATADLSVSMTDSPDPVTRRTNMMYAITVKNIGSGSASGVTLTDKLPTNMRYVSVSSSQGSCSGTTTVSCNLGTINNGGSATVNIFASPRFAGTYTNTVSVKTTTQESITTNNTATAVTTAK